MKNKLILSAILLSLVALGSISFNKNLVHTEAAEDLSGQTEMDRYWMSVSATSSTSSEQSQSVNVSFATGYSSFATERITTVVTGVSKKGASITYSKDIEAPDTADFDAFYYDGKDGNKAFSKMTDIELNELADTLRKNYATTKPSVYDAVIKNINRMSDALNNICIIPSAIYRSDVGGDPYVPDMSSWTLEQKGTPIFTTEKGDSIYGHEEVIFFGFNPETISSGALEADGASTFTEIFIPKNIKTIYADSFFHDSIAPLPTCVFRLEATKAEIENPENEYNYEAGCFGTNPVSYGYSDFASYYYKEIDASTESKYNTTKSARKTTRNTAFPATGMGKEYDYNTDPDMANQNNYFLGYYPADTSKAKPLIATFDIVTKGTDTVIDTLTYILPAPTNGTYYSVGKEIYKIKSSLTFDILYENLMTDSSIAFNPSTMAINPKSISLYNIYHAVLDNQNHFVPHEDPTLPNPTYCGPLCCTNSSKGGNLKVGFTDIVEFKSFIDVEFHGFTTFSGYTSINLNFKKTDKDIYKKLNNPSYRQYENLILSGQASIRYRVDSLKQSTFRITLKDNPQSFDIAVDTPVKQFVIEGDNYGASFLLKDSSVAHNFSASNIKKIDMLGFTISLDLVKQGTGPIGRTGISNRFGSIAIVPTDSSAKTFDGNMFIIIFMSSFTGGFIVLAVILFFILKNKFKNDEFRRVNKKKYIKTSIITYISLTIVLIEIIAIIFRTTLFRNAIVVFNPVDAYIISFGVASILVIGYSIKYAVTQGKAIKARKMAKRLKLDEDVAQDGTN